MISRKVVQSHDQTERVTEIMIRQKGCRGHVKRKGLQSHDQTERGLES